MVLFRSDADGTLLWITDGWTSCFSSILVIEDCLENTLLRKGDLAVNECSVVKELRVGHGSECRDTFVSALEVFLEMSDFSDSREKGRGPSLLLILWAGLVSAWSTVMHRG